MTSQYRRIRVTDFKQTGPFSLLLTFNDGLAREIDFLPALELLPGGFFRPLRRPEYFKQVKLNTEAGVIEWPNEADFNPETLHDWPHFLERLKNKYAPENENAHAQLAAA